MRREAVPSLAWLLRQPRAPADAYAAGAETAVAVFDAAFAVVYTPAGSHPSIAASFGEDAAVRALAPPPALFAASSALASTRVAGDERFPAGWSDAVSSLLAAPISVGDGGVLVVGFASAKTFSEGDLGLADEVAAAIGCAVERGRLLGSEGATRALSARLAAADGRLARRLEATEVLQVLVEEAVALADADAATVTLAQGLSASAGAAPGAASVLAIPLEEPAGVLSILSAETRSWGSAETEAIAALAANAAVALGTAERFRRLALTQERTTAIFASIADGIVAVDPEGSIVLWNQAAETITGVPARESVGQQLQHVLGRELASPDGGATRLVAIPREGSETWLALSETVMYDLDGAVAGRVFVFRDISAEHAVEQMKSEFVSSVSLGLRAPLASIYGFAQTLLRDDVPFNEEERATFLGFIASEAERVTETIDALLNVARLETGDLSVALEPTDIVAIVDSLVVAASGNGFDRHRVVADLAGDVPAAHADPVKLRDVLDQLVSNAIRFSPDGGTVTVSARQHDGVVELAVSDEGVGIPLEERERIFAKFTRAGTSQGRSTGVGLFIAQGLVREMGGLIRVDSNEGSGSRFTFELPIVGE